MMYVNLEGIPMKKRYPLAVSLALGLLAPVVAVSSSQGATTRPAEPNVSSPRIVARQATAATQYWTGARMKAALPLDTPSEATASTAARTGARTRTLACGRGHGGPTPSPPLAHPGQAECGQAGFGVAALSRVRDPGHGAQSSL